MSIALNTKFNSESFNNAGSCFEKKRITYIVSDQVTDLSKVEFCYKIAQETLKALVEYRYSAFDAQTTTNCCHGISLLVKDLIAVAKSEDLSLLHKEISERLEQEKLDPQLLLTASIIDLSKTFILSYIRTICPIKGVRSSINKLKEIHPLGTAFYTKFVADQQKDLSNRVAFQYGKYLSSSKGKVSTCGIPIETWGKYIEKPFLRKSTKGVYFAPTLYSLQVTLSHLIFNKSKIAIVNDIYDYQDQLQKRDVRILVGNGVNAFIPPTNCSPDEPLVVFGGCAYSEDPDLVVKKMTQWMDQFPNLVLANDVFYPQFPKNCDDPLLKDTPIVPEEKVLQEIIASHKQVEGVSTADPSFYVLNHIFPASLHQINEIDIPSYKIPKILLNSEIS